MRVIDTGAHERAANRLRASCGSIYEAFDGLGCGIDHDGIEWYLAGSLGFQSLPEDVRGKVVGLVMGTALTVVESDRETRGGS